MIFQRRPIKFRVWDLEDKKWLGPEVLMCLTDGRIWNYLYVADEPTFWSSNQRGSRAVLLQYTGLKDCTDTEIYDGDIVTHVNAPRGFEDYYVVQLTVYGPVYIEVSTAKLPLLPSSEYGRMMVVAGNIFENPQLVGGKVEVIDAKVESIDD